MRAWVKPLLVLAAAAVAWLVEPYVFAESPKPEPAAAAWSQDSKDALDMLCMYVHEGNPLAEPWCNCIVEESEKRIPEEVFLPWLISEGQVNSELMRLYGSQVVAACQERNTEV